MEASIMGSLPVGRLLRKMSMPLIFSMLVQVLYGLVDSLYVAQLGDNALTAISLCMPVQYLVLGVGTGIGVGVNSVLSKKLGEKDQSGVNLTAGNGFLLLWVVMILFTAFGLTAMTPFYQAQTDIPEILEMCISYSEVLCVFSFAALHQIIMERLLSAIGRADLTMIPMLTGAVINIILDPVMIFGWLRCPAMGIAGAGIATVTAQVVAALTGLALNIRFNHNIHITKTSFAVSRPVIGEIVKIGVPVVLSQCLIALMAFGMNSILLKLSALAPGIYVIFIRLQSFVVMPSSGMSNAGISIIAYNYGAREKRRIMDTLWVSLRVNLVIAATGMLVFLLFPRQLLAMFNASAAMSEIGIPALRMIAAALVLTTSTQILSGFLQALGQGTASFVVAVSQAAFLLLSAWLLSLTGSAILVWLAFPIMEILRFVIAALTVSILFRSALLRGLFGRVEPEVMEACMTYLVISALSFPALAVYNSTSALFRSMNRTRTIMNVSFAMNIINVAGNAIGIFVLRAGVAGVAVPSLISRTFTAAVMLAIAFRQDQILFLQWRQIFAWKGKMLGRILGIAIPNGVENGLFQLSKVALSSIVALFGTVEIAANGVAQSFWSMASLFAIAFGYAFVTVIGQCMGAGDVKAADYYNKKLLRITYLGFALWNVLIFALTPFLLTLYSLSPEAKERVVLLVLIHGVGGSLLNPLAFSLSNGLRAAGDIQYTMYASIFATVVCRVFFSLLLGVWMDMGVIGITLAMVCDWLVKAILVVLRYRSRKWTRFQVI